MTMTMAMAMARTASCAVAVALFAVACASDTDARPDWPSTECVAADAAQPLVALFDEALELDASAVRTQLEGDDQPSVLHRCTWAGNITSLTVELFAGHDASILPAIVVGSGGTLESTRAGQGGDISVYTYDTDDRGVVCRVLWVSDTYTVDVTVARAQPDCVEANRAFDAALPALTARTSDI